MQDYLDGHPKSASLPDTMKVDLNTDEDLSAGLALYKFIINHVPIAVIAMDSNFRIIEFNPWAERITGYSSEAAVGRRCWEILQSELCDGNCPLRTVLDQVNSTITSRITIHDKQGRVVPVQLSIAALFNAEGRLIGGVEAFMDISQLVAMERERSNFISMLAHDMRSSLTGIHGLALRLLRKPDELDAQKEKRHLELITGESAKLESLIDDFIELSRIESGRLVLNITATSLDKELEELFELYKIRAAQHGIALRLHITEILPAIEVDANRMRRVFTNLLDNAIKFSKEKGTITITAEEKDTEVMVSVVDEGTGIDPEDLPHIFDIFHRGRATGKSKGHGLGLATVKAVVESHGGRILVSSQLGAGSTFTVFLPKKEDGWNGSDLSKSETQP